MAKWADYGISEVRYNSEHTHIDKVKVHEDKGESIGSGEEWFRTKVVSALERDTTFVTILKKKDGTWRKGQEVHVVTIHGVKYIRTDKNQTTTDNLEDLPEF